MAREPAGWVRDWQTHPSQPRSSNLPKYDGLLSTDYLTSNPKIVEVDTSGKPPGRVISPIPLDHMGSGRQVAVDQIPYPPTNHVIDGDLYSACLRQIEMDVGTGGEGVGAIRV
jgi:hypothetical protein